MGVSKNNIHSEHINYIASIAKVFAHPARVAILKYISEQEGCICNDLVDEIGLAQATISQHLSVIGNAGLLEGTFEGKRKCYCINEKRLQEFTEYLSQFFNQVKQNSCC